jgi:3-deoxy-7-phosphoheptulonate synthase
MQAERTNNVNVISQDLLLTPAEIKRRLPITPKAEEFVLQSRDTLQRILDRQDPRLFVIVGPCSIHDLRAARDYAQRLKQLAAAVADTLFIVMRVYFEKPRTTVGWKGLINDPYMDDSFHIEEGLQMARGLLLELAEMGVPAGTEALDPISPQYFSDLITWYAIGARTTESQTHREMASGLSAPVGFKNNTDGSLDVAINAMLSVSNPHRFLGINHDGQCAIIRTKGNRYGHVVLRGGGGKPNYDSVTVALCEKALATKKVSTNLVIDCSHDNSNKDPGLQPLVLNDGVHQILEGNQSLVGFMLESNINYGKQAIPADLSQLQYGVSVTDGCIDWATTDKVLLEARDKLKDVLLTRL